MKACENFLRELLKIEIIVITSATQHLFFLFIIMYMSVWVYVHMAAGVLGGWWCQILLEMASQEVLGVLGNK